MSAINGEPTTPGPSGAKVWIHDGIVYIKYDTTLSLSAIVASQAELYALAREQNLSLAPVVVLYEGDARKEFDLSLSDLSKVLDAGVMERVTGYWLVNAPEAHRRVGALFDKFFTPGRIHFVDTIEEARLEAKQSMKTGIPVLEPLE